MLECVINVSEGRRARRIEAIVAAGGTHVVDVHRDPDHNRSVVTIAGPDVEERAFAVVAAAVEQIDIREHEGVHPRLGAADVVPFVPLAPSTLDAAVGARDRLARRVADELLVPCFLYGPERTLPDVRRRAFRDLAPDVAPAEAAALGPVLPHPTAGSSCVGARPVLVAYNLWLEPPAGLDDARAIARSLRCAEVRSLGLAVADGAIAQVSCNLVEPLVVGPAAVYDEVAKAAPVARAELVGLVPAAVLDSTPPERWHQLDLSADRTIEARLERAGLDWGSF